MTWAARATAVAATAVALSPWAAAPSAARWTAPRPLMTSDVSMSGPQVASSPSGAAVAVWTRSRERLQPLLEVAFKRPGESFSAPRPLAGSASPLSVAASPNGTSAVVWSQSGKTLAVRGGADGGLGRTFGISGFLAFEGLSTAVDDRRELFVMGQVRRGLAVAVTSPGGRLRRPQRLTRCRPTQFRVAVNRNGSAAAAWICNRRLRIAVRRPGGMFRRPALVPGTGDSAALHALAVDQRGTTTILTTRFGGQVRHLESVLLTRRGSFRRAQIVSAPGTFVQLGPPGGEGVTPALEFAHTSAGGGVALWQSFDGVSRRVEVASRPPFALFEPPVVLAEGVRPEAVAISGDGGAAAVWTGPDSSAQPGLNATVRMAGGQFGLPQTVTSAEPAPGSAHVVAEPGGASALWLVQDGRTAAIQTADYTVGGS